LNIPIFGCMEDIASRLQNNSDTYRDGPERKTPQEASQQV